MGNAPPPLKRLREEPRCACTVRALYVLYCKHRATQGEGIPLPACPRVWLELGMLHEREGGAKDEVFDEIT